ncbi:LLM class flavin-dependent oxidoreductase [Kitasatospora brasiliensis]|uniref:LLM class flavin-dependent oxidoreductase n=1 Tax=Kitasatospora brasiliensis TaxID=3058040 RepID=UPI002930A678|nr:LLM class flavin-dependent oxidoreductase [Kitasatospora sp. K002]
MSGPIHTTPTEPNAPRIGAVVLPEYDWEQTRLIWTGLEDLGLHHAWTYDHHSWRSLSDAPWYDALTTLTAVACVTSRIEIGTLVSSPNFRHPAVLAKQVMTLDQVSNGRFAFGIGAGAPGNDAQLLGLSELSAGQRADRFEEFVELSDLLLRQPTTNYRGAFFEAVEARMIPGCVQLPRVPFAIAAAGPRGMRLAARYAARWVTIGDARQPGERSEEESWHLLERQISRLADACKEVGREPSDIGKLVNVSRIVETPYASPARFVDVIGRCHDLGFTDVVINFPRQTGVFSGDRTDFERAVSAALEAF